MSGLIVAAVTRAVLFEVEQGARHDLAMDRLWFWRMCDLRDHEDWHPGVNRAATNHFLAVHRENRISRFGQLRLLFVRLAGRVGEGSGCGAARPPARPAYHVPASNTTPESLNLRLLD